MISAKEMIRQVKQAELIALEDAMHRRLLAKMEDGRCSDTIVMEAGIKDLILPSLEAAHYACTYDSSTSQLNVSWAHLL